MFGNVDFKKMDFMHGYFTHTYINVFLCNLYQTFKKVCQHPTDLLPHPNDYC